MKGPPVRKTRGAALLTATALAVTGLAACGDEGGQAESSTTASPSAASESSTEATGSESSSSPSSSSAVTSGEEVTELPAAAKSKTQAGAAAFGQYYHEAYGDAAESGDASIIETLRSPECKACLAGEKQIKDDAKKGWHRDTNPYSHSGVKATKRPDEGYKVTMTVKATKHHRLNEDGEPNAKVDATSFTLDEHVAWRSGRWVMLSWIATPQ